MHPDERKHLREQLEEYHNGLQRYIILSNITITRTDKEEEEEDGSIDRQPDGEQPT